MTRSINAGTHRAAPLVMMASPSLLLASCQKSSQTAEGSQAPAGTGLARAADVCALLGKEVIGEIIGQAIVNTTSAADSCKYESDDAQASSVEIVLKRSGAADKMATARKAADVLGSLGGHMAGGKGAVGDVGQALQPGGPAPGVGEQAFFDSTNTLHVLDKGAYLEVSPPLMRSRLGAGSPLLSGAERQTMAKTIAQKVLAGA